MINDSILYELKALRDYKSFSKAADELHISQPSLSIKIKKLEQELGCQLFARNAEMELTTEGRIVLEYVKKRQLLDESLVNQLKDIKDCSAGTIKMGCTPGFSMGLAPALVSQFKEKFPNIDVFVHEDSAEVIRNLALEGKIDFFISCNKFNCQEFESTLYKNEHIFLCAPSCYRDDYKKNSIPISAIKSGKFDLAKYGEESLENFTESKFILLPDTLNLGQLSRSIISQKIKGDYEIIEIGQMTTAVSYVKYGMGVTFVTEDYLQYADCDPDLQIFYIDSEYSQRDINIVWCKDAYISEAAKKFISMMVGGTK